MASSSMIAVAILLSILNVAADSGRFSAKGPMERQQPSRSGSKAVRNLLFASKIWLNTEQARKISDLQAKGNDEEVIRQLTEYYRGLSDKSRAALRVQSTCRAILSDEVGQSASDELITMKTKILVGGAEVMVKAGGLGPEVYTEASSSEFVSKIHSLFRNVKNSDVKVIEPLCVAAYEDSHVPTANDPRRLRRSIEGAAAA